ncbi:hypothetical protein Q3G72_031230 [Acer saccharum]|nr:hypothetical protein Q3G72_031230 [Acer saccharum]
MIKVVCCSPEKIRDKICCKVAAAVDKEATVEVIAVSTTSMKTIHKVVLSGISSLESTELLAIADDDTNLLLLNLPR